MATSPDRNPSKANKQTPPLWLMAMLGVCVLLLLIFLLSRGPAEGSATEASPSAIPSAEQTPEEDLPTATPESAPATPAPTQAAVQTPEPTPAPTPAPTALPTAAPQPMVVNGYDFAQPVPQSDPVVESEWFSDAVFIGDSRTDGFHLYSGITVGDFLDYNGITVFDVAADKPVIRQGDQKVSILTALGQKQYGKVYLSLGVNELGYFNAQKFADTYAQLLTSIRACQPNAAIYVQAIIPVNTAKCEANDQPYYVTNEGIADYNAALATMTAQQQVYFLRVDEALLDETGQVPRELTTDGVHFKKDGYVKWLDYLLCHTVTADP